MAGRSRLGCWLGGLGCALVVSLVLFGGGLAFTSIQVMRGEPEVGGVDVRDFDVLGLSDARSASLQPVSMRRLEDGRLELCVEMVRTGGEAWEWTGFTPRLEEVRIEGLQPVGPEGDGWSLSTEPAGINGPSRRVPITVVVPVPEEPAVGAQVALKLKIRISSERMGGLVSMSSDTSYGAVEMGRWGEWYDLPVAPVSGQLTPSDTAVDGDSQD